MARPTGQATLNTSHPLAGRLVHGYVFSEGTGTTRNLVQTGVSASPQGGASWVTNAGGSAISTATGGWIDSGVTLAMPQSPLHIVVGVRNVISNDTEGQQAIVSNTLDGGTYTNAGWPFAWFYNGSTAWVIDANAAFSGGSPGSYDEWPDASTSVYTAGPHHFHVASEAAGTTLYHNGTSLGTFGTVIPGVTPQPLIFGGNGFTWQNFRAEYDYVYIFSGTLTTAEIDALRADPYGLVTASAAGPTRFYLPSTGTGAVSPAFDAAWDDTSAVVTRPANTTKGTSAFAEVTDTEISTSNTWDVCLGRFISAPLAAQTLSGTVMGIIRARESATGANARSQMVIRVVSNNGTTVRGTLLAQNNTTTNINEWVNTATVTAARNARFPVGAAAATLTSVAAQDGDRIVIEVGARAVNTVATSFTLGLRFGENATDAANNETGVTEAAPWVEFSQTITFQGTSTGTSASTLPNLTATAAATRTIPNRTATSATTLSNLVAAGTATRTLPVQTATSVVILPLLAHTADAAPAASDGFTGEFTDEFESATDITGASAAMLPHLTASAAATRTVPADTATSAVTLKPPVATATGTRAIPTRTGTSASFLPVIREAAAGARAIPDRTATSAAVLPKSRHAATGQFVPLPVSGPSAVTLPRAATSAVGTRTIPTRTAVSTSSLPKLAATAVAGRTIPTRTGTSAATLRVATTAATGARTIPARTATSAVRFPVPTTLATAQRLIPDRLGTSSASLRPIAQAATGSRTVPGIAGSSPVVLAKPVHNAIGQRGIGGQDAISTVRLPSLGGSATGTRTLPDRIASSPTRLKSLSGTAAGSRTVPDRLGVVDVTLVVVRSSATGQANPPGVSGEATAALPRLIASASGDSALPVRNFVSAVRLPKPAHTAAADYNPPVRHAASDVRLPNLSHSAAGRSIVPGAVDIAWNIRLTGTMEPDVYLTATLPVAPQ